MSTRNGRSRKLQTIPNLVQGAQAQEQVTDVEGGNLPQEQQEAKCLHPNGEAIAKQPVNEQTASQAKQEASSPMNEETSAVAEASSSKTSQQSQDDDESGSSEQPQQQEEASAEEVLRAAKKASQQGIGHSSSESDSAVPNQPQAEQQCDDIAPASSQITESTTATAAVLVELAQQASEKRFGPFQVIKCPAVSSAFQALDDLA